MDRWTLRSNVTKRIFTGSKDVFTATMAVVTSVCKMELVAVLPIPRRSENDLQPYSSVYTLQIHLQFDMEDTCTNRDEV